MFNLNESDKALVARLADVVDNRLSNFLDAVRDAWTAPHVIAQPDVYLDGDKWCALYGTNVQDGIAGFGDSVEAAMKDFDNNWKSKNFIKPRGEPKAAPEEVLQNVQAEVPAPMWLGVPGEAGN